MDDSRRRGRQMLLILAAMFLLPVVIAFVLYYGGSWRPAGLANKGELIRPRFIRKSLVFYSIIHLTESTVETGAIL